ncbi:hypothetical protein AB0G05_37550 [Nonomuraea wenchangensis]
MRWVTFDCFGTLVDWRHGLRTSAELIAPGRGERLLEAYNRHEHAVQTESPALRYRHVLAETLRRLPVPFDAVVTAEDAGDYKPSLTHFTTFRRVHEPAAWVHVAQSYFHDLVPAHRLGLRRIWINRLGERAPDGGVVQRELPDLRGLLGAVESA